MTSDDIKWPFYAKYHIMEMPRFRRNLRDTKEAGLNTKQIRTPILALLLSTLVSGLAASAYNDDSRDLEPATVYQSEPDLTRLQIREAARTLIGHTGTHIYRNGKQYPNDCSGMVRSVFDSVGIDVFAEAANAPSGSNGVAIIYHAYKNQSWADIARKPRTGDLIVFNNTYDKNKNKRWDDPLTHVAIVTGIEENGTVVMIHHVNSGIRRYRMNFDKRNISIENGVRYNNALRVRPASDPDRTKYLTSNLFYRYIDVIGNSPTSSAMVLPSAK